MNVLLQKIQYQALDTPGKVALQGVDITLDYQSLVNEIEKLINEFGLSETKHQSYAILMDNDPAWAVLDLALLFTHQCVIPLPKFFSVEQLKHALIDSQVEHLLVDDSVIADQLLSELQEVIISEKSISVVQRELQYYRLQKPSEPSNKLNHPETVKITYTSGTTSRPKGVALSEDAIISKVVALAKASEATENDLSLSLLPLSTLLENIGGLYVPLFCGASVILIPPEQTGILGSSKINPQKLLESIHRFRPTAFIIIPQLLQLLISAVQGGYVLPDSIRFIAMGGAPVSKLLLGSAKKQNIPVFEGYGLSEAASVVAVNSPKTNRLGSVGKVLGCHQVQISDDGEILVQGHLFNGYLGNKNTHQTGFYATGDLGRMDKDGFLYITGRKKNIINTSYGRNISPEWIEKELEACPFIAQCLVYGHAKPFLIAIIVPYSGENIQTDTINSDYKLKIAEFINHLNNRLPDYARILETIFTGRPFTINNMQLTGTGRPRRAEIYQVYENEIHDCYEKNLSIH